MPPPQRLAGGMVIGDAGVGTGTPRPTTTDPFIVPIDPCTGMQPFTAHAFGDGARGAGDTGAGDTGAGDTEAGDGAGSDQIVTVEHWVSHSFGQGRAGSARVGQGRSPSADPATPAGESG